MATISITATGQSFKHRELGDGTWDSVCMRCYATIVNMPDEDGLLKYELKHDCQYVRAGEQVH
jgi:hypothetical protein